MTIYFSGIFFSFFPLLLIKSKDNIISPPNTLKFPFRNIQWTTLFLERSELAVLRSLLKIISSQIIFKFSSYSSIRCVISLSIFTICVSELR